MEAKSIATSLGGERLSIFPCCPRSSFVSKTRFSRLPLKRTCIGGVASGSGVDGYRGLALTRWNPIVSTRRLVTVRAIDSDLPHPIQQVRFEI